MKKILFIEDEKNLHKSLKDFLSGEDIKVISAFDGEEGLDIAGRENFDLVLLDLILPKMHGLDVLKKLKEGKNTANVPIIIFTNLHDIPAIQEAVQCGINCYLLKEDYSISELVQKIKSVLNI